MQRQFGQILDFESAAAAEMNEETQTQTEKEKHKQTKEKKDKSNCTVIFTSIVKKHDYYWILVSSNASLTKKL